MRDEKEPIVLPDCPEVSELLSASDIGFKRGIVKALDALKAQRCLSDAQYDQLLKHTQSMQFNQIKEDIEVTV
jgi:hypothetical protein